VGTEVYLIKNSSKTTSRPQTVKSTQPANTLNLKSKPTNDHEIKIKVADLDAEGDEYCMAKGGMGGEGNFKRKTLDLR
jgi:GTPase involved in cell partitioning and DNA repair